MKDLIFKGVPDAALIDDAVLIADASEPTDAPMGDTSDAPMDGPPDGPPAVPRSCAELKATRTPSGVYLVRPDSTRPPFQVYCEQELEGGGWAMVLNSVRRDDGTTTAFWQFAYDDRLKEMGTLAVDQNYYHGALYQIGREYMDVIVDLQDRSAMAAAMTATGFDPETMRFTDPMRTGGDAEIYNHQFAAGWSARDRDADPWEGDSTSANCAVVYGNVAQHYGHCWVYNLGADSDPRSIDGGVGPHVYSPTLTSLGLALQADGGNYSQVNRIARFTRW